MPAIAVIGSADSGHDDFSAGTIVTGEGTFTINGIGVAKSGSISTIHANSTSAHVGVVIGSAKLTVNGVPLALVGDPTACGAAIASGQAAFTID